MPLSKSSIRLEPFQSAPARFSPTRQNIVASEQRKKTVSIAGICATCLTKTFANEKASVERNIARTPSVRIVPGYEDSFFDEPPQPQSASQPGFDLKEWSLRQKVTPANPNAKTIMKATI
jgi:hypothetical protein